MNSLFININIKSHHLRAIQFKIRFSKTISIFITISDTHRQSARRDAYQIKSIEVNNLYSSNVSEFNLNAFRWVSIFFFPFHSSVLRCDGIIEWNSQIDAHVQRACIVLARGGNLWKFTMKFPELKCCHLRLWMGYPKILSQRFGKYLNKYEQKNSVAS